MKRRERKRINNDEFLKLLVEFDNHIEQDKDARIGDTLGQLVDDLIYNIETSGSFNRYTYRDEMRSEARKNCFAAIHQRKFSLKKENPFGYFTTIVMNSFYKVISDEKRQSAVKNAMYEEVQLQFPNSRFEDQNEVKSDVYKSKVMEHSVWMPLKTVVDGKERVFETQEEYDKFNEKKRKKREEKEEKELKEKEREAKKKK